MKLERSSVFTLLILVLTSVCWLPGEAANTVDDVLLFYRKVAALPSGTLMDMAHRYQMDLQMPDSALYCLAAVSERYSPSMNAGQKQMCIDALNQQYHILSFTNADYSRSMDCLNRALEISRTLDREQPRLYFNLGTFHQVSGIQAKNDESTAEAYDYYTRAFDMAERQGDGATLNNIYPNLLTVSQHLGRWEESAPYRKRYRDSKFVEDTVLRRYNLLMADAMEAQMSGDTAQARTMFESQIASLPETARYARQLMMSQYQAGLLHMLRGDYGPARAHFMRQLELARRYDMPQIELEVHRNLFLLNRDNDRPAEAHKEWVRYLEMKDSVLNERISRNVTAMQFVGELQNYTSQLRESRRRQRMLWLSVGAAMIVAGCAVGFTIILRRRNKRLSETNAALYEKTQEMLTREGTLPVAGVMPDTPCGNDDRATETDAETDASASERRHRDLRELYARIHEVMEHSPEVLQPGFNMVRMAELTESNSTYVSRAVNTFYGQRFDAMLSERRIREACIRISDASRYGHLTLEAVMNDVGIRSRATFTASFKRVTGLTPSEYQAQARRRETLDL